MALITALVSAGCTAAQPAASTSGVQLMTRHLGDCTYRLEPVFRDDFRTTANWRMEGEDARLWTQEGWLHCDSRAGDVHAATIWCAAAEFTDPVWAEFDIRFMDGRFNGNLIFHARSAAGGDVLESSHLRKGNYDEYHVFPNYILTFLNDRDAARIRYRRNPGFALLGETFWPPALELGRTYHVVVVLQAGHVQFWVDGVKRYEGQDPSPLTAGRFAWRTWRTWLAWSNLRICRIVG